MVISQVVGKSFLPEIIIDQEDFFLHFCKRKWYVQQSKHTHYVRSYGKKKLGEAKTIHLHRLIMNQPNGNGVIIDHKDGNGLNNQRNNLRAANNSQNVYNKAKNKNNRSGYKGVSLHQCGPYRVVIFKDGKQIQGGYFDDIKEAALKYNELATKHFGEFARLNIIPN